MRRALLALLVLAAACGRSAAADAYADRVCRDLDAWIRSINGSLQELSAGNERRTSADQERRAILDHLADVQEATSRLTAELEEEPAPEVDGGAAFAGGVLGAARRVEAAVRAVRAEVKAMPRDLQQIRADAGALLGAKVGGAVQALLGSLTEPASGDLADSFDASPACEDVVPEEP